MDRRKFFSLFGAFSVLGSASLAAGASSASAQTAAYGRIEPLPEAVGVLHDSARCIGCRKCEAACQEVNADLLPKPDRPFDDLSVLEKKRRTSIRAYTVVNKYVVEGREKPIFRKHQCNHCLEPACVSACLVKAMVKTPEGPVVYNPDLCMGCRYCMVACPYFVPAFDYHNALHPRIYKCTFCAPRLKEGKLPGCVKACPAEALQFGARSALLRSARKRVAERPDMYDFHIYGEHEMGGAGWLYLAPVRHAALGLPPLGKTSAPELTAGLLGNVAMLSAFIPTVLGGAFAISHWRRRNAAEEREEAVTRAVAETEERCAFAAQKERTRAVKEAVAEALAAAQAEGADTADNKEPL